MKTKHIIGGIAAIIGLILIAYYGYSYYALTQQPITNAVELKMGQFGISSVLITAEYIEQEKNSCLNVMYSGIGVLLIGVIVIVFPKKIEF